MELRQSALKLCVAAAVAVPFFSASIFSAEAQTNDKWLTVVLTGEPANLDGCQSSRQVQGRILKQNIVETLIKRDPNNFALSPRLVTGWQRVDDVTWRFDLRRDVNFHDGTPMDAAAVKWSLDRTATQKGLGCGDTSQAFTNLQVEITTPDPYTILMKTSRPEPIMPTKLANVGIVSPTSTVLDKNSLTPVGTGPYVFDSWQPGQQIVMKRNEKYWGPKPPVEGVRFLWRGEPSIRAAMVAVGEADIAVAIGEQDATDPQMDHSYLNSATFHLRIDSVTPPLNDRRVRLALDYAVDRESVMKSIMPQGTLYATQIVVPAIVGHNHELDKNRRPYDPAKAKALLAEAKAAGVPVDKEILLISYPESFPNAGELMEGFLGMFKAIGLNMKIQTVEVGQYTSWNVKPYPDPRPPYVLQSLHDNISGDPGSTVPNKYSCTGGSSGHCNPAFDKQIAEAAALDGEARAAAWSRLFQVLYEEEVPDVVLFHMAGFIRTSKRINYKPDVASHFEIRFNEITFK